MKTSTPWIALLAMSLVALVVGCSDEDAEVAPTGAAGYVAFSADHYQSQIQRLAAYQTIAAARREATAAPTTAEANAVYVDTIGPALEVAELLEKVKGRQDDHDFAEGTIGTRLEADILYGVELGSTADDPQRVAYAGQLVDKTLLAFFYYSVFYELTLRTKKNHDEAFGYYGLPNNGDGAEARGLALTAVGREGDFSASLNQPIFGRLVDGRAVLAASFGEGAAQATEALPSSDAAYSAVIEDVDRRMLLIFALGVKHELQEAATDEPDVKLIEANRFWLPLRGWVEANVPGADFAMMDAELLGELEGAPLIEALEAVAADPSVLDAAAVTAEIDKVIAALQ